MRNTIISTLLLLTAAAAAAQEPTSSTRGIPSDQLCGAEVSLVVPAKAMRIAGGAQREKQLFSPGDAVIINAGSAQGVKPGQQFVVRRVVADRFAHPTMGETTRSVHTAGWITIVEVQADVAIAKITEACDGVIQGDYLEP